MVEPDRRRAVIFTTSELEEDIAHVYDLEANSFIVKPLVYTDLVDKLKSLSNYWLWCVELPPSS